MFWVLVIISILTPLIIEARKEKPIVKVPEPIILNWDKCAQKWAEKERMTKCATKQKKALKTQNLANYKKHTALNKGYKRYKIKVSKTRLKEIKDYIKTKD